MEHPLLFRDANSRYDAEKTPRLWPWFVPIAIVQVLTALCLWHHIRSDTASRHACAHPPALDLPEDDPNCISLDLEPSEVTLYTDPVTVIAKRDLAYGSTMVTVRHGSTHYEYTTYTIYSENDLWTNSIRETVGWKGDYLFVMRDSEGSSWRAERDAVLKLQWGKLIEVGNLTRMYHDNDEQLGPGYYDGYFHEIIDRFKHVAGHFGSKGVGWKIVMQEKGGNFVADLDRTWEQNQETLKSNKETGDEILNGNDKDGLTGDDLLARFGENVLIADYCGRKKEAQAFMQQALKALGPRELKLLAEMRETLTPGELPDCGPSTP